MFNFKQKRLEREKQEKLKREYDKKTSLMNGEIPVYVSKSGNWVVHYEDIRRAEKYYYKKKKQEKA